MTKNQKRTYIVLAILFVAFSVIAFAQPFAKNGVFWLAYLFGVISIAIQIYVLKVAFDGKDTVKSKYYGFPIARVGIIYMIAQLVLSIVFMLLSAVAPVALAIVLFVVLLAAAAIGCIGVEAMRDEIERQETKIETDTSCITALRAQSVALAGLVSDEAAKKAVADLAEKIRFSDPVSGDATREIEAQLTSEMTGLKDIAMQADAETIIETCKKVTALLEQRNAICKAGKK